MVLEDTDSNISKETIKELVKKFREKLITHTSGTKDEFLLKKLFDEVDINKSGNLTADELYILSMKI